MNYNRFSNLSCYEEFEIQSALTGISKVDILKEIGYMINNYYFFISNDGIFNWYDLNGNRVEDPGILKELKKEHIPLSISKCIIPDSVTNISKKAFCGCKSLISITIPDSVTSIGNYAFYNCKSLKEIVIPNSVINIGYGTFYNCKSLKEIVIPNSITDVGYGLFCNCKSLISITIPDGVINIDDEVFCDCKSLTSITIPDGVINIGYAVFWNCASLQEIIFKGKTLDQVKQMKNYPFGIEDNSIIKCEI